MTQEEEKKLKEFERKKKWRMENREHLREYQRWYRRTFPEIRRKWQLKNKDRIAHLERVARIANPEKAYKKARDHYARNPGRPYGLSADEYRSLVEKQQNRCAICGSPPQKRRLCVDHDHTTGKVRELLCRTCNAGLGHFKDNEELLLAAASYLKKHVGQ